MSNLPSIPLPSDSVEVGGSTINIKSLTRQAALKLPTFKSDEAAEAEAYVLSEGTGVSMDEARSWLANTDFDSAQKVLAAILVLSGLKEVENEKN